MGASFDLGGHFVTFERFAMRGRKIALSNVLLKVFRNEAVVFYGDDQVTRLIVGGAEAEALALLASITVGELDN